MTNETTGRQQLAALWTDQGLKADRTLKIWESAVLLPLRWGQEGWEILFEVRASTMTWQPGDICFPGGHREDSDPTLLYTALRETEEELGIPRSSVQVLGPLPYFYGPMGPLIFPFAGILQEGQELTVDPEEVGEVFAVPLKDLLAMTPETGTIQIGTHREDDFPEGLVAPVKPGWKPQFDYTVYFYPWKDKMIWGITARVLHNFLQLVRGKGLA